MIFSKKRIPNILTASRLFLLPFGTAMFYIDSKYSKIGLVFVVIYAIISDALDGYLARKWNAHTDLGKMLDQIADKITLTTAMILFIGFNNIHSKYDIIPILILVSRDFFVSGLRELFAKDKLKGTFAAKLKTTAIASAVVAIALNFALVGSFLLWISVFFSFFSAIQYCINGKIFKKISL